MMIKRVQSTLGANLYLALLNAAKIWQKQMNYRKTRLYVHIPIVLERTTESNIIKCLHVFCQNYNVIRFCAIKFKLCF